LITRLLVRSFQSSEAKSKFSIIRNDRRKFRNLVELSRLWQWESSAHILHSTITVNQKSMDGGEEARIWYAEAPSFGPLNGFSAPRSFLWTSGFNSTGRDDTPERSSGA